MKETFSMKDLITIFHIPKSTLLFWEKKELLHPKRDPQNNYRIYDIQDAVEISDILLYRKMGMPIHALKNLKKITKLELETMLDDTASSIDQQLNQLNESKTALLLRKKKLAIVEQLQFTAPTIAYPSFQELIPFKIENSSLLSSSQSNPYDYTLIISLKPTITFVEAVIKQEATTHDESIWILNEHKLYKKFLLKTAVNNPLKNNIQENLALLGEEMHTVNTIIASYLVTFTEEEPYDFYQAWFEFDKPKERDS